jgi:hypothetical protein
MVKMNKMLVAVLTACVLSSTVFAEQATKTEERSSSSTDRGSLWGLAQKACAVGEKINDKSLLLPALGISQGRYLATRFYQERNPLMKGIEIPDEECQGNEPVENSPILFVIGHVVANASGYYYLTSTQGKLIKAVHASVMASRQVNYDLVDITPEIQADFESIKAYWLNRFGRADGK